MLGSRYGFRGGEYGVYVLMRGADADVGEVVVFVGVVLGSGIRGVANADCILG